MDAELGSDRFFLGHFMDGTPLTSDRDIFSGLNLIVGGTQRSRLDILRSLAEGAINCSIPLMVIDRNGHMQGLAKINENFDPQSVYEQKYWNKLKQLLNIQSHCFNEFCEFPLHLPVLKSPDKKYDAFEFNPWLNPIMFQILNLAGIALNKSGDYETYLHILLTNIWEQGLEINSFSMLINIINNDQDFLNSSSKGYIKNRNKKKLIEYLEKTKAYPYLNPKLGEPFNVDLLFKLEHEITNGRIISLSPIVHEKEKLNLLIELMRTIQMDIKFKRYKAKPSSPSLLLFDLPDNEEIIFSFFLFLFNYLKEFDRFRIGICVSLPNSDCVSNALLHKLKEVNTWLIGQHSNRDKSRLERILDIVGFENASETAEKTTQFEENRFLFISTKDLHTEFYSRPFFTL